MAAGDALNGAQFGDPTPAKPKTDRIMAYRYPEAGITFCPSCHRQELKRAPLQPDEEQPKVMRASHYGSGDIDICSGGCGKNIRGAKEMRWEP